MVIILRKTCAGNINLFSVMSKSQKDTSLRLTIAIDHDYHIPSGGGPQDQLSLVAPVLIAILSPSQVLPHSHV